MLFPSLLSAGPPIFIRCTHLITMIWRSKFSTSKPKLTTAFILKLWSTLDYSRQNPNTGVLKKGCHPTLWNIRRRSFALSRISKGKVTNLKIPGCFQKSTSSRIPEGKVTNLKITGFFQKGMSSKISKVKVTNLKITGFLQKTVSSRFSNGKWQI